MEKIEELLQKEIETREDVQIIINSVSLKEVENYIKTNFSGNQFKEFLKNYHDIFYEKESFKKLGLSYSNITDKERVVLALKTARDILKKR